MTNAIAADIRNRPAQIQFYGDPQFPEFNSGNYEYDGSSNITAIGFDTYQYDLVSRLVGANLYNQMPVPRTFAYSYDLFGNMLSKELDPGLSCDAVCIQLRGMFDFTGRTYQGNRITNTGFDYTLNGNLKESPEGLGVWDSRNRLVTYARMGTDMYLAKYDADGYRTWRQDMPGQRETYYLRNAAGQVLSEYSRPLEAVGQDPAWSRDYVYGFGKSLALVENEVPVTPSGVVSELDPPGSSTLRMTWFTNPETDVASYRLYESDTEADDGALQVGILSPATTMTYALTGGKYIRMSAMDEGGNESPLSDAFYVEPNDATAPGDVTNLTGVQGVGTPITVELDWTGVSDPDLQGYRVYRKLYSDPDFPANPVTGPVPLRAVEYTDTVNQIGVFLYKVTAVDFAGNESAGKLAYVETVGGGGGGGGGGPCNPMCPITELRDGPEDPLEAGWVVAWQRHPGPDATEAYWEPLRRRTQPEPEWAVEDYRTVGDPSDPAWRIVWLHSDHLGSVRMTSLADGSVESYHTYEPFGWEVPQSNSTSSNSHRFTGHERDRETGLDYMLARYYANAQARFLSVDPNSESVYVSNPQSWNRFAYVMNSPLLFIDPRGEKLEVSHRSDASATKKFVDTANDNLHGKEVTVDRNGSVALESNGVLGPPTEKQAAFEEVLTMVIDDKSTVEVTLVDNSPEVLFDQSGTGKVDMQDVQYVDSGDGISSAGVLGHALAEQFAIQTLEHTWAFNAHTLGIDTENYARSNGQRNRSSNLSAGQRNPSVFLGLWLSRRAILLSVACEYSDRSVRFGRY